MRGAILFMAMLLALPAQANSPDISARRLLSNWKSQDPMMSRVAEVIAAAFSGGLSWRGSLAGKEIYCPPPGVKGHEIMISFEQFLNDNPDMADKPYGRRNGVDAQPSISLPSPISERPPTHQTRRSTSFRTAGS